jgi:hypothetical protein
MGEQLSESEDDAIDLRMTSIASKLKGAGYMCYYFGKGHTGFKSMHHMPLQQGFDKFVGFLGGEQSYTDFQRWNGNEPFQDKNYSTRLYMDHAVAAIEAHPKGKPMFMYLPWQSVHGPYEDVPEDMLRVVGHRRCTGHNEFEKSLCEYLNILAASDHALEMIVHKLQQKQMWGKTLLLYTSDNGGVDRGNNYPLRGEKNTNWEGGVRAAAFVSGGFVPSHVRGTTAQMVMHIADWYPTFCHLAGLSPEDQHSTMAHFPGPKVPDVDGVNLWDKITSPESHDRSSFAHKYLWISAQVLIKGDYKLIVAQPKRSMFPASTSHGYVPQNGWKQASDKGWAETHISSSEWVVEDDVYQIARPDPAIAVSDSETQNPNSETQNYQIHQIHRNTIHHSQDHSHGHNHSHANNTHANNTHANNTQTGFGGKRDIHHVGGSTHGTGNVGRCSQPESASSTPCLFNVADDPSEFYDVAQNYPALVKEMWAELKRLNRNRFINKSPGKLLGTCNKECARSVWQRKFTFAQTEIKLGKRDMGWMGGPMCAVPECASHNSWTPSYTTPANASSSKHSRSHSPSASVAKASSASRPGVLLPDAI